MILLRLALLVVDLFTGKKQDAFIAQKTITVHTSDPNVMVRDDHEI
jgi:hypothetical protein